MMHRIHGASLAWSRAPAVRRGAGGVRLAGQVGGVNGGLGVRSRRFLGSILPLDLEWNARNGNQRGLLTESWAKGPTDVRSSSPYDRVLFSFDW